MLILILSHHAYALLEGKEYAMHEVSTLRINIQHEHFLRSINKWEYYDSKCSAVIVGTQPLTLLTAAHCLKEVKLIAEKGLPEISIVNPEESGVVNAKLTQAFYRPYQEVAEDITLDIAVLVFEAKLDKKIKAIPISSTLPKADETLLICGFGKSYLEREISKPRCGKRNFLSDLSTFQQIVPSDYQVRDEMLYIKSETQFSYTKEIAHTNNSLIAINRINSQGLYDDKLAMITEGDSGGAWIEIIENNHHRLVAISSLVERFYNKSPYWSFFKKDTPLSDYPYIAYGLRLDNQIVKSFLNYCKNSGADIVFE